MFTKFWTLKPSNLGIRKNLQYCSDISLYLVEKIQNVFAPGRSFCQLVNVECSSKSWCLSLGRDYGSH